MEPQQTERKPSVVVGIADYKVGDSGDMLVTFSLGSCVGIVLLDVTGRRGGLAHCMLPDSAKFAPPHTAKYVDVALEQMISEMRRRGWAGPLRAVVAGGANMFPSLFTSEGISDIGERNVAAARAQLAARGIQVLAEDTGKDYGRTVEFHTATGEIFIKSIKHGLHRLYPR
jgi:chemotaxis protein CheD